MIETTRSPQNFTIGGKIIPTPTQPYFQTRIYIVHECIGLAMMMPMTGLNSNVIAAIPMMILMKILMIILLKRPQGLTLVLKSVFPLLVSIY